MTNLRGWESRPLGKILKVKSGAFLPAKALGPNGTYAVYGGNGINGRHTEYMFEQPVLVIGRVGVYCGVVHRTEPRSWVTDNALVITDISEDLDVAYLEHALRGANLNKYANQSAQPLISASKVYPVEVLVPPLPEQHRIAAILDKADAIQRKRKETIRLTEEFLRSAFLEMFGDPLTNPRGWPTQNLGEMADFVGGGTPSRAVPSYFEGTTCWATSKDMSGEILVDTQEHITDEAVARSATKLVQPGTILVVVKSKVLMHRLPVLIAAVRTCFGQDLKGIVLKGQLPSPYVARHMRIGQASLLRLARGVNTEGLTLEHLRGYQVMVPPLALVRRHESLEQKTLQLRKRVNSGHARSADLAAALMDRAFRGDL